jgi:hypothetical protein
LVSIGCWGVDCRSRVKVSGIPHVAKTPDFLSISAAQENFLRLSLRESRTRGHNGRCVVGNPGSERDAPNFLHAALDKSACAPFFKQRRMKLVEPNNLYRKSGMWGTQGSFAEIEIDGGLGRRLSLFFLERDLVGCDDALSFLHGDGLVWG